MKIHKILQKKQKNGLWGTPINCIGIDRLAPFDKELLQSAAISLISQIHNCNFRILNSDDYGFHILLYKEDILRVFSYKNYELVEDTLYEFDDEKEHISFLRKQKIKQIESI